MAQITISITATATQAQIDKVIDGLEMTYGRLNGETDLQYVKRIFKDLLLEAYKRKEEADVINQALIDNPTSGDVVIT